MSVPVVHHVFRGERLQAFSDGVFAIVATIMVIPLKLGEGETNEHFDLRSYLYHLYPRYLVYLFSFILVVDTWYSHTRIFAIVEQVDDVILWLNLLSLLFISFLPYSIGLISRFQESDPEGFGVAVSSCSTIVILTGIAMIILVLYVFRQQAFLHPELASNTEIRSLKVGLLITFTVNPILALASLSFAMSNRTSVVAFIFFYGMGLTSFAVRIIVYIYHRRKCYKLPDFAVNIFRTVANKSRTEAFSDGVFAIVATLIVLDFTTQVPSSNDVHVIHHGNLKNALHQERFIYLSFVACFCIVGLLWFVQYGMFHFVRKITPTLSFINTVTLCLVGGIPFVSSIYISFADETGKEAPYYDRENELMAVRASAVLVFLVGVSQLLFWTFALFNKTECLYEEVDCYPAEILMFIKIMIFPTVSGIIYALSFSETLSTKNVYGSVVVVTPFIFLLVKAGFTIHERFRKRVSRHVSAVKDRLLSNNDRPLRARDDTNTYRPSLSSPINSANTRTPTTPEAVRLKTTDSC